MLKLNMENQFSKHLKINKIHQFKNWRNGIVPNSE